MSRRVPRIQDHAGDAGKGSGTPGACRFPDLRTKQRHGRRFTRGECDALGATIHSRWPPDLTLGFTARATPYLGGGATMTGSGTLLLIAGIVLRYAKIEFKSASFRLRYICHGIGGRISRPRPW